MNSVDRAKKYLGELILMGFSGTRLSDDTAAFLSQAGIGGILYFAHNYESPEQIAELTNSIQECRAELPLWIAVDQEGGRVQRFKDPFTILPRGAWVGKTNSPKLAYDLAEMMAKELRAVGVNLNFCPVVDIFTNPKNQVIGDRAYGSDEDTVSKISTAIVRGHVVSGVQACVKHFPGHGHTLEDSHDELPRLEVDLETLRNREFKPFVKAFKSRCNMVMSAHILNPHIDPKFPATFSSKTLKDILRKELRYSKIIISDDLEMKAITNEYSADQAPFLALEAGCDMLIYRTEEAARHAYQILFKALDQGDLNPEIVNEAVDRILSVKKTEIPEFSEINPKEVRKEIGLPEHKELAEKFKP